MKNPNGVLSCIVFLVDVKELDKTNIFPRVYVDIVPDEILLPALKKISTPGKIKTISFMMGKFSTLCEAGAGGKIMIFSLVELAKRKIALPHGSKNQNSLEILAALASPKKETGKEIGAVIYLPD